MPEPWGTGSPVKSGGYEFAGVGQKARTPDTSLSSPADGSQTTVPTGGASTHYAFDVKRDGKPVTRVVFVDTSLGSLGSLGSLSASDPGQQPSEVQLTWLDSVLSSRPAGERAVVVSNTPTYSYGPGTGTDTQTPADATAFEAVLLKDHVSAVVSGRLGWNGLYCTSAPAVHSPQPGGDYPASGSCVQPPASAASGSGSAGSAGVPPAASGVSAALVGTAAPAPPAGAPSPPDPTGAGVTGLLPTVVASSAGGKFGPDGQATGTAGQGYWHGYTIVRLDASGDPGKTIVEQRPVFDWVGIRAAEHTLQPGQTIPLKGRLCCFRG